MRFVKEKNLKPQCLQPVLSIDFIFENMEGSGALESVQPSRDCSSFWISSRLNILIHNYIKAQRSLLGLSGY